MRTKRADGRTPPTGRVAVIVSLAALSIAVSTFAVAQVRPGGGGFGTGTRPPAAEDDAFLFHVLSRTTYGADEASLAEIRALGAKEFLWRQLHPETIDDSALEAKLAAELPPQDDLAYQQRHLRYEFLTRARYSQRQLQEILVQFWENHFDTVVPFGNNDDERHAWTDMERLEDEMFRRHAFGRFRDLLEYSAKSQAMMYFLDNYRNNVASGNENYARELMELHSLGVDCGYDQWDVQEVARIWTGWSGIYLVRDPADPALQLEDVDGDGEADFAFNPRAHDFSPKDTLGTSFPAGGGLEEGELVLDILSRHPCTARFISGKLLEVFVTDTPSPELVDRIAGVFLDTDGDVRQVLLAIFESPEFRDPANFGGKVRTPIEFTIAAQRALEASVHPAMMRDGDWMDTYWNVYAQGMQLFDFAIPTGYKEVGEPWITANGFLQRWKYADRLASQWTNPARATSTQPMQLVTRANLTTADQVIDHFSRILLGRTLAPAGTTDPDRRTMLRDVLLQGAAGFDPAAAGQDGRLREMVGQLLGAPEFQQQ